MSDPSPCPCQSGQAFAECCQPLLTRQTVARSPVALMRSRYVAFCLGDMDYLVLTTHPDFRARFDVRANAEWSQQVTFSKLEILESSEDAGAGIVVFCAHFKQNGTTHLHRERSTFRKAFGLWFFCEGQ